MMLIVLSDSQSASGSQHALHSRGLDERMESTLSCPVTTTTTRDLLQTHAQIQWTIGHDCGFVAKCRLAVSSLLLLVVVTIDGL